MIDSNLFWGMGWMVWALPLVLVLPGYGFAQYWGRGEERPKLAVWLDATWIGLAITWLNIAVIRELGVPEANHQAAIIIAALLWAIGGHQLPKTQGPRPALPGPERLGLLALIAAIMLLGIWKAGDIARPLHGYWHLNGADTWEHEPLPIRPTSSVREIQEHGGPGSGAFSFEAPKTTTHLQAIGPSKGTMTVAIQGPVGSYVAAAGQTAQVQSSMVGEESEGLVRRYLDDGVAAVQVSVDLQSGDSIPLHAKGERIYLLTGADAVWALHAEGTLRYVHYYQILNQVENQVWAQDMLIDRWATLNQPPGWSPILSTATVLLETDLPAAGVLFLWVLVLLGLSAIRLISILAPHAPTVAFILPSGMVLAHGLLMLEPGSQNFPDSLYAAALIAVAAAIAEGRTGWIVGLGIAAGLLRWPGVIVSTIFVVLWWKATGQRQAKVLAKLWIWVGMGAIIAAIGVATGVLQDLLFILYFETFPEHWHGEYSPTRLLPRVPGFYALWTAYTGGGLVLAAGAAFLTQPSTARRNLRWLLSAIGVYSLMLATIDHHPTHYFLPLIAMTGVALACAAAATEHTVLRRGLPVVCLTGLAIFLFIGDVGIQPIEDMVVSLDGILNDD